MTLDPLWGQLIGVVTLLSMLAFIGIWIWLWLPQHKRKFDRLSRLPMQETTRPDDEHEDNDR
ncbi:MAG: cbb3-type cytochrome c oxidase subunit 3 [Xanthomonadales bacterium]|nr:cbb3-type cytochrome c oxidase subunit 3 [Xanthomonadales bacterium]